MTKTFGAKTIAVVVIMTVVLTVMSACGGSGGGGDNDAVVGKWNVTTVETMGITMDIQELADSMGVDLDMYAEFKSGGEVVFNFDGELMEGTYSVSGSNIKITIDGDSDTVTFSDGVFVMEDPDIGSLTFVKE